MIELLNQLEVAPLPTDAGVISILSTLEDEEGRHVASEKLLEIDFNGDQPLRHGDQFGLGRVR